MRTQEWPTVCPSCWRSRADSFFHHARSSQFDARLSYTFTAIHPARLEHWPPRHLSTREDQSRAPAFLADNSWLAPPPLGTGQPHELCHMTLAEPDGLERLQRKANNRLMRSAFLDPSKTHRVVQSIILCQSGMYQRRNVTHAVTTCTSLNDRY